jgi:hypothetical protein
VVRQDESCGFVFDREDLASIRCPTYGRSAHDTPSRRLQFGGVGLIPPRLQLYIATARVVIPPRRLEFGGVEDALRGAGWRKFYCARGVREGEVCRGTEAGAWRRSQSGPAVVRFALRRVIERDSDPVCVRSRLCGSRFTPSASAEPGGGALGVVCYPYTLVGSDRAVLCVRGRDQQPFSRGKKAAGFPFFIAKCIVIMAPVTRAAAAPAAAAPAPGAHARAVLWPCPQPTVILYGRRDRRYQVRVSAFTRGRYPSIVAKPRALWKPSGRGNIPAARGICPADTCATRRDRDHAHARTPVYNAIPKTPACVRIRVNALGRLEGVPRRCFPITHSLHVLHHGRARLLRLRRVGAVLVVDRDRARVQDELIDAPCALLALDVPQDEPAR